MGSKKFRSINTNKLVHMMGYLHMQGYAADLTYAVGYEMAFITTNAPTLTIAQVEAKCREVAF